MAWILLLVNRKIQVGRYYKQKASSKSSTTTENSRHKAKGLIRGVTKIKTKLESESCHKDSSSGSHETECYHLE